MRSVYLAGCALLALVTGLLQARDGDEDDFPEDKAVRVESDAFHPPVRLTADGQVIDHGPSWGHTSPWLVDVDGDGIHDLVVGDFSGHFRVYHNEGTEKQPRYAKGVNLKAGGVDAQVPIY